MDEAFKGEEDSRLKGYNGRVTHPTLPLERTYCSNCGKPYGWASVESSQLIAAAKIVVYCNECEHSLEGRMGPIPFPQVSNDDMRRLQLSEGDTLPETKSNMASVPGLGKLQCPKCAHSNFHLEDQVINGVVDSEKPQIAICHCCSDNHGQAAHPLRKGWLLRERVQLVVSAA